MRREGDTSLSHLAYENGELRQQLEERDKTINQLERKIRRLEQDDPRCKLERAIAREKRRDRKQQRFTDREED